MQNTALNKHIHTCVHKRNMSFRCVDASENKPLHISTRFVDEIENKPYTSTRCVDARHVFTTYHSYDSSSENNPLHISPCAHVKRNCTDGETHLDVKKSITAVDNIKILSRELLFCTVCDFKLHCTFPTNRPL